MNSPGLGRLRTAMTPTAKLCETVMQPDSRAGYSRETEGVGFEPTVGFPTLDFESSALNRTQPPFLWGKRKRRTPKVQHSTSNATVLALSVQRSTRLAPLLSAPICAGKAAAPPAPAILAKKCYNFLLAMPCRSTASCVSTRTATLLLVVDWYSQVVSAAVH